MAYWRYGQALAVENRLPEPKSVEDALRAPLAFMWKGGVDDARRFIGDANASWKLPFAKLESEKGEAMWRDAAATPALP